MKITPLSIEGALRIEPVVHGDHRGFFMESYNENEFNSLGVMNKFIQDNHSLSIQPGVLRGLHYQLNPKAQTKLVRVLSGAIYDVVVDLRRESPTFGQWEAVVLTEYNKHQLLVPKGFAHGFCTLVPNTQVFYKVDEYYSPEHDRGILWNDPDLGIDWPTSYPILSDKDKVHPVLKLAEINFE
ncbi:dTDP-4-dehydrorhamnose 3,5-epimerase [Paenibacillus thiaminolyticus]|uniref:dTDP-4-dehydrorhamnose 3,5-epimerase n=1 Tax=Paenibacillus thiaminolyticus TaxID=49283 RepID=A0AAP9J1F6_PANTH|nr:dTDP-4-dehydrorhamnose 3,5-epimerase [Paenibacillus thiaminolyticus]MCY9537778.1 dTDP-4-dehydrorhamnose 3,5-epimerase [Paenibacillus thiaminolyticus]MCY9604033.1 dTDP-4-dehydrorhamnose 3,5-epimerase [Paenibacillus thiaminolyticus]MCY9606922.1 dTDP-4-dehydrorhamnose 3,5-epimerase [Paenibacillus thiaminolyticus]MCY9616259.1 dTDP-4-dehydrorhamnose 3,5-epimerase [Paenibacillus thiaminolyticus]MCY9619368.1 dTDP-4-dehydrorhamnose 3,5-epimerase [Paenibacillus thiaminolyticus]